MLRPPAKTRVSILPQAGLLALILACNSSRDAPSQSPAPPDPTGPHSAPVGPPPPGSGGAMQDPSGFPGFHETPPPPGPAPAQSTEGPRFSDPIQISPKREGGYRPQVTVGPDGRVHAVFYIRHRKGDLLRYRSSDDGEHFNDLEALGFPEGRNWGPDLVARDGEPLVVFDLADASFRSQGWLTQRRNGTWSDPVPLTPGGDAEVGSGHVAQGVGDALAYVYIGKPLGPENRFTAWGRWRAPDGWKKATPFTDGRADAWHTNVERRPDGSVLAAYDVGPGGSETRMFLVEGRDGVFSKPIDFSRDGQPGERAHFAFAQDGTDHIAWFHKRAGLPLHVFTRTWTDGVGSTVQEPSAGLGGYHYDPDIEINQDGVLCLVWGWDGGDEAELLFSLDRGSGWSPPKRVASIAWGKPGLPSLAADPSGRFHVVWNQGVKGENQVYSAVLNPALP